MFRKIAIVGFLVTSFIVAACGAGSSATPSPTPLQVTGITPFEKALSIADMVSQNNPDIYVVSEAAILDTGLNAVILKSDDKSILGSGMLGTEQPMLWYTIVVTKPTISFGATDQSALESGAAQLLSLTAEHLLAGKQSFSLIVIAIVYQDTSTVVYVDSYQNLSAEAAKTTPDYLSLFKGALHNDMSYTVFLDNDPLFAEPQPAPSSSSVPTP